MHVARIEQRMDACEGKAVLAEGVGLTWTFHHDDSNLISSRNYLVLLSKLQRRLFVCADRRRKSQGIAPQPILYVERHSVCILPTQPHVF